MSIEFFKYQGTGNDFILVNNFDGRFDMHNAGRIQHMCNRHFGIGADGLMVLEPSNEADFKLTFFNPDASLSFCGNGSRCAVRFARDQKIVSGAQVSFTAFDGLHRAEVKDNDIVVVSMRDVSEIKPVANGVYLNTGAPHVVVNVPDLESLNILTEGPAIRYDAAYNPVGTNVNFMQEEGSAIKIRTYEKGVEDETLSCGTGVTASALAYAYAHPGQSQVTVHTRGGRLTVHYTQTGNSFTNVALSGPASFVFSGTYHG